MTFSLISKSVTLCIYIREKLSCTKYCGMLQRSVFPYRGPCCHFDNTKASVSVLYSVQNHLYNKLRQGKIHYMKTLYVVCNLLDSTAPHRQSVSTRNLCCVVIADYCLEHFNLCSVGTLVKSVFKLLFYLQRYCDFVQLFHYLTYRQAIQCCAVN